MTDFLYDTNPELYFRQLNDELPFAGELRQELSEKKESFADCLFRLMRENGIKSQAELTAGKRRTGVSKAVISKWINNRDPYKTPDKATVYALIISAHLSLSQAAALLKSANLAFGHNPEDIIVQSFVRNQMYDLDKLNEVVYDVTHRTLINRKDN